MRRYELEDKQWEEIQDLFTSNLGRRGRPFKDHRQMMNGMLWILFSGASWRDLPERYGPWKSVYDRFRRWQQAGTFEQILQRLHLKINEKGLLDWNEFYIDSTYVKAAKAAAGASKKKA